MPKAETELFFIGIGLLGLQSCTMETFEILRRMDKVYIEKYTNFISEDIPPLLKKVMPDISIVTRRDLEETDHLFLEEIKGRSVALLIPGDPFVATTHNSLRLAALQKGFTCKIVHNASILTAAISVSGLSAYRFGRTVTCPFPNNPSEFPYEVIKLNKRIEAHTLVLLDIETITEDFLTISEAILYLLELEEKKQEGIFTKDSLVVGLAKIGSDDQFISAGKTEKIRAIMWKDIGPPQSLIICSDILHFTEKEALKMLWNIDFSNPRENR
ncbi:MAG: diphthine synthase [Promethearchaeota archaeon]